MHVTKMCRRPVRPVFALSKLTTILDNMESRLDLEIHLNLLDSKGKGVESVQCACGVTNEERRVFALFKIHPVKVLSAKPAKQDPLMYM